MGNKRLRVSIEDLQNAVAITSVAEILKTKVTFSFGELVTQSLLKLGTSSTHQRVNRSKIKSDSYPIQLSDKHHEMLTWLLRSLGFVAERNKISYGCYRRRMKQGFWERERERDSWAQAVNAEGNLSRYSWFFSTQNY